MRNRPKLVLTTKVEENIFVELQDKLGDVGVDLVSTPLLHMDEFSDAWDSLELPSESIFDLLRKGVAIIDNANRLIRVNTAFAGFVGCSVRELVGRDAVQAMTACGVGLRDLPFVTARLTRRREHAYWDLNGKKLQVSATPLSGAGDDLDRVLCTITDVTYEAVLEAQLEQSQAIVSSSSARIEHLENELLRLHAHSHLPDTETGSGVVVELLRLRDPESFARFVDSYADLLTQAVEEYGFKILNSSSSMARCLAQGLVSLDASSRDIVEIHGAAMSRKTRQLSMGLAKTYANEGRMMLLQLLGEVLSAYRLKALTQPDAKLDNQVPENRCST